MRHGIHLRLTVTHRKTGSGIMVTDTESFPYRCKCGQGWMDARTLVAHITEAREKEACETS